MQDEQFFNTLKAIVVGSALLIVALLVRLIADKSSVSEPYKISDRPGYSVTEIQYSKPSPFPNARKNPAPVNHRTVSMLFALPVMNNTQYVRMVTNAGLKDYSDVTDQSASQ